MARVEKPVGGSGSVVGHEGGCYTGSRSRPVDAQLDAGHPVLAAALARVHRPVGADHQLVGASCPSSG